MILQENIQFDGHYTLIRQLGQGGFSEVWLAHDSYMDLDVALKIYAPGRGMDSTNIEEFRHEIKDVFMLNHPNLLRPQYLGFFEKMPYLVLAYCKDGSVSQLVGKMKEEDVWKLIHDVASGLAYLHKNDIVHQDIKPDNILIDEAGNYVITDFGISAKARSTLRKSMAGGSNTGGTMAYMGPERFSKQPAPTKASDIWSFGAMVYELITGNVPFGEMGGGMQKGGAEIPEITEPISDELRKTIESMLALETWDRPTAEQLIARNNCVVSSQGRHTKRFEKGDRNVSYLGVQDQSRKNKQPINKKKLLLLLIVPLLLLVAAFLAWKYYAKSTVEDEIETVEQTSVDAFIEDGITSGTLWAEISLVDDSCMKMGENCKIRIKTSCDYVCLEVTGAEAGHTIVGEMVQSVEALNIGKVRDWEEIWKPSAEQVEVKAVLWSAGGKHVLANKVFKVAKKLTESLDEESQKDREKKIAEELQKRNRKFTVGGISFIMVNVEAGSFMMGHNVQSKPIHKVTFSEPYYIGQTEVTQELWTSVMGTTVSQQCKKCGYSSTSDDGHPKYPMCYINWDDCQSLCRTLNSKLANELGDWEFAIPTEAQWEYAARGGKYSKGYKYSGSNKVSDVGWTSLSSGNDHIRPVAGKKPNELGIYDMSGNAREWCYDWWLDHYESTAPVTDPMGPTSGQGHVTRGGAWFQHGSGEVYDRGWELDYQGKPAQGNGYTGFRLALVKKGQRNAM